MLSKKKIFIILILSIVITGTVCSSIVYTSMLQTSKIENSDLYGTYQIDIRNIDNTEYLAIIPSVSSNKNKSQFQWYNIDKKMIAQGVYEINESGYITLDIGENNFAVIFIINGKYYLVNDSLETQEITKISEEAMVSILLEE